MKVVMLTKPEENPARIGIGEDNRQIVLILDTTNEDLKVDAEYDENEYTQEEVQAVADKFMNGLLENIKDDIKNDIKNNKDNTDVDS